MTEKKNAGHINALMSMIFAQKNVSVVIVWLIYFSASCCCCCCCGVQYLLKLIIQVSLRAREDQKSFPLLRGDMLEFCMEPTDHEEIRGGVWHRTPPWANQQTFTVVVSHGHLPAGHGTLKTEQKTGKRRWRRQSRPVDSESKRSIGRVCSPWPWHI